MSFKNSYKFKFRYDSLHKIFYDRPSRQEDMEIIKLLKFELQSKIDEIEKNAELMKFYKLEL